MRRVVFIELFNKPKNEPLGDNTKIGKFIEDVIIKLDDCEYVKTSLVESKEYPLHVNISEWINRFNPYISDVFVLIGREVRSQFKGLEFKYKNQIYARHPSSLTSQGRKAKYANKLAAQINKMLITNT